MAETKALEERLHHADQVLNALGGDHYAQVPPGKEAASALTAAQAEIERLRAEQIVAPAECSDDCDDPDCPYNHTPLTLRQAYENAVSRMRAAETENATLRARNAELVELLDCALGEYEITYGQITDKTDPHWSVRARNLTEQDDGK